MGNRAKTLSEKRTLPTFTTGQAATFCQVSQQTIIRCFDNGTLKGFRVPGSRFRRIPRDQLFAFMKDNGIPTDILDGHVDERSVGLLVPDGLREAIQQVLREKDDGPRVTLTPYDDPTHLGIVLAGDNSERPGTLVAHERSMGSKLGTAALVKHLANLTEAEREKLRVLGIFTSQEDPFDGFDKAIHETQYSPQTANEHVARDVVDFMMQPQG